MQCIPPSHDLKTKKFFRIDASYGYRVLIKGCSNSRVDCSACCIACFSACAGVGHFELTKKAI